MANLYKKPTLATDPKTGRKIKRKSKKWWGRYRDALGRDCREPLAADKAAAQAMLNELVCKAERQAAGKIDPLGPDEGVSRYASSLNATSRV